MQRSGVDAQGSPASLDVATYLYGVSSDNLAAVTDGSNRSTSYSYDDFGRIERLTSPTLALGGARWFRYDARGNAVQRGDSTVTVSYAYDGLDRLLALSAANVADGSTVSYQYFYDEGSFPGQLTSITEPDRIVTFTYDWAGRLAMESVAESGIATPLVTEYGYDADGALVRLGYPSGLVVSLVRDPATGEVSSITNAADGKPFASGVTHVPGGPLASLTFGNGRTLSQTFNRRHEPRSLMSGPLSFTYTPTPAGDVASVTDGSEDPSGCLHGVNRNFSYDLLDRLVAWNDSVTDGTNRCPAETIGELAAGFTYLDGTDLLSAQWTPDAAGLPAYSFGYDYQGNVSAVGQYDGTGTSIALALCLRHDALGRLAQVGYTSSALSSGAPACVTDLDVTSPIAQYRYDSRNRRVARSDAGGWTYFVTDASGNLLSELAPTGDPATPWARVRDYVWLDGRPLAQIEYDTSGPYVYYVHSDHLGTPRALTNQAGQLVWSTYQRPYGEVGEKTVPDPLSGLTVVTNLRLPGQYDERVFLHAGLGLQGPYYNWNRWYLPGVGRYLELDPIAMAGGFNGEFGPDWYGYANQSPLNSIDPEGLSGSRPGGPYHPPDNVTLKCTPLDSCRILVAKMDQFKRMIDSHTGWDQNNCKPNGGNRHILEIDDLWKGYAKCQAEYESRCGGGSPVWLPVPSPFPRQDPTPYPVPGYPRNRQPIGPPPAMAPALLLLFALGIFVFI
ncbi:RHS repeat domain-containing protein [Anaeromyxobacter oryzisoli]|uniref:RHS repeat domain-containing protein n=1 Tax=Anaeromyxobacter oryzisoli TaxID=2925408 RepID=UPI001F55E445|nr:RHS domain-containing protein [Anaeromyxobacter sp. SG63]